LGDNQNDINDNENGNNNVMGTDKNEILHGTHVAGIVAQTSHMLGGDGAAYRFYGSRRSRTETNIKRYCPTVAQWTMGAKVIMVALERVFLHKRNGSAMRLNTLRKKDVLIVPLVMMQRIMIIMIYSKQNQMIK
jgi:subtilisin family serine protease